MARNSGNYVMMMPEVSVSTMNLVLQWSIKGSVDVVDEDVLDEIKSLLSSFDACADVSVEHTNPNQQIIQPASIGISQEELMSEPEIDIMGLDEQSDCSGEMDNHVVAFEGIGDSFTKNEFETDVPAISRDPLDEAEIIMDVKENENITINHELDESAEDDEGHIRTGRRLRTKTRQQTNNLGSVGKIKCQHCDGMYQTFYKYVHHLSVVHYNKQLLDLFGANRSACPVCEEMMHGNERDNIIHLGIVHQKILLVACTPVKAQLNDLLTFDRSFAPQTRVWKSCKSHFTQSKHRWLCCRDFTNSPQELRFHLARAHYEDQLLAAHGPIGNLCKLCPLEKRYEMQDKRNIVLHMVSSHSYILYSLMNEQEAVLLQECFKNEFNCPICNNESFGTLGYLRRHLCRTHFKDEILKAANGRTECGVCEKFAQTNHLSHYADHLGTHGYLDLVLPDDIKEALAVIESHPNGQADTNQDQTAKIKTVKKQAKRDLVHNSMQPFPCPLCSTGYNTMSSLRSHIAVKHYYKEIFSAAGVVDVKSNQCPQCEKQLTRSKSHDIAWHMARHLGVTHDYLNKVIPDKYKINIHKQSMQ